MNGSTYIFYFLPPSALLHRTPLLSPLINPQIHPQTSAPSPPLQTWRIEFRKHVLPRFCSPTHPCPCPGGHRSASDSVGHLALLPLLLPP